MITGFGNNVVSALAADITASQTTIQVMPGAGAEFAGLLTYDYQNTSNDLRVYAKITLTDAGETEFEVCHLTEVNNDMLTVVRGQEGTVAKGWSLNDVVANFATRGSENQFVQIEHLQSGHYTSGVAGGTANALTLDLPASYFVNGSTSWELRAPLVVYPTSNNTGPATLQLTMGGRVLGTFKLYKGNKAELVASDIMKDVALVCLLDKTKTFFNVANPGAIYAGLGTAAFRDVTTSNIDTTNGRVLKVGDYGLTRAINVASGQNVVTFLASAPGSFYHFDGSTNYSNAPNFGGNWFDVYMTIHETTNYRTIIAVSASGVLAYAAITNGAFSGWSYPFTTAGGNLSGNIQISTAAPIIQMSETDTGKQYYIIVDGSGFRINEDGPSGRVVLAYSANSSKTTTTGQFVPADYGNFDNRYPVRDAINFVGLEADNPLAPYMRRISNNSLVYLAARDWVNSNFMHGGIRLASLGAADNGNNDNLFAYAPDGAVVTAVQQKANYTAVQYRYVQYNINGNWYTAWVA